jgi:hypothetical protein
MRSGLVGNLCKNFTSKRGIETIKNSGLADCVPFSVVVSFDDCLRVPST